MWPPPPAISEGTPPSLCPCHLPSLSTGSETVWLGCAGSTSPGGHLSGTPFIRGCQIVHWVSSTPTLEEMCLRGPEVKVRALCVVWGGVNMVAGTLCFQGVPFTPTMAALGLFTPPVDGSTEVLALGQEAGEVPGGCRE